MSLSGNKTYITAGLLVALAIAHKLGYVDDTTFNTLQPILLGGGLAALRAGVKKSGP